MPPVPFVVERLKQIETIHRAKNEDYAGNNNPHENFERSAHLMSWFNYEIDKAYINLIATKLARLATLLNKNGEANNESIDDSFLDLSTYTVLWAAYHNAHPKRRPINYSAVEEATLRAIEPIE